MSSKTAPKNEALLTGLATDLTEATAQANDRTDVTNDVDASPKDHADARDNATDNASDKATDKATDKVKNEATATADVAHPRNINTFMRRRTHVSKHAEIALNDSSFRKYIINTANERNEGIIEHITNLRALFADTAQTPNGKDAPLTLEIGFGMGSSLIEMAAADPTRNFVGIEVHEPGIGKCAYMAAEQGLTNIKLINGDAILLMKQLPNNHIDRVQLYFPDPWQKRRHYKRRFVNPERMQLVTDCLKPQGWFHTATDWEHYAFCMLEVLDNVVGLTNQAGRGHFAARPDFRPMTKFENRGLDRGHGVWDLIYIKESS